MGDETFAMVQPWPPTDRSSVAGTDRTLSQRRPATSSRCPRPVRPSEPSYNRPLHTPEPISNRHAANASSRRTSKRQEQPTREVNASKLQPMGAKNMSTQQPLAATVAAVEENAYTVAAAAIEAVLRNGRSPSEAAAAVISAILGNIAPDRAVPAAPHRKRSAMSLFSIGESVEAMSTPETVDKKAAELAGRNRDCTPAATKEATISSSHQLVDQHTPVGAQQTTESRSRTRKVTGTKLTLNGVAQASRAVTAPSSREANVVAAKGHSSERVASSARSCSKSTSASSSSTITSKAVGKGLSSDRCRPKPAVSSVGCISNACPSAIGTPLAGRNVTASPTTKGVLSKHSSSKHPNPTSAQPSNSVVLRATGLRPDDPLFPDEMDSWVPGGAFSSPSHRRPACVPLLKLHRVLPGRLPPPKAIVKPFNPIGAKLKAESYRKTVEPPKIKAVAQPLACAKAVAVV